MSEVMINPISHDWSQETLDAKARWFASLSLTERMDYLCQITDLILENNPDIVDVKYAQSPSSGVRILTCPRR